MLLTEKKCRPCSAGTPPLTREQAKDLAKDTPDWYIADDMIWREFKFEDFQQAMGFVEEIADLAEDEGHHPNIHICYNRVKLECTTHKIGGLSENDFILAAKIDKLG